MSKLVHHRRDVATGETFAERMGCEKVSVVCPHCLDVIALPKSWTTPHAKTKTCRACRDDYEVR